MGSVQKRPNGSWRARYTDPSGAERAQHFPTRDAAVQFLSMQVVRLRDGTWIDPLHGRRTFGSYAQEWTQAQLHHRSSTAAMTATRMKHLVAEFGERPIASIDKSDVQAWVAKLSKTMKPATVEAHYRLLSQVMLAAVEDRKLIHTPCRKIRLPERDGAPLEVPTAEQIAAVYAKAPDHARALILTGVGTGLRVSEMAGLTVDRVDFLRRTVTVDRQLIGTAAGQPRFGPPKTKASVRTIPVPEDVTDAMADHLARWPSDSVVFRNAHGTPWRRGTLTNEFRRWCKHAKVEGLTWHGLRHHYASGLIAAGLSPTAVQARLGHSSATITLDVYGHLWPSDDAATRTAVEGLVAAIARTADGLMAQKPRSAG